MPATAAYSAVNPPMAFTPEFLSFVQTWDVVVVWDKDHTMVDPDNILRPNMEAAILDIHHEFPTWRHVVLTENRMASVQELFDRQPSLRPVFDMILCEDNYFSRPAVRQYLRRQGYWFVWGRRVDKERSRRKRRRVNDIFLGKKVVLVDDLRDGRIPEHSFCVSCKVWTGEPTHRDEVDWPLRIKRNILRVLKNLYHYQEPARRSEPVAGPAPGRD